jgi:anti-sigma-K factor RskA
LQQLEAKALESAETSERLAAELTQSREALAELSTKLADSETRAGVLSSSLERAERSLEGSARQLGALRGELWAWRVATVGAALLALVFFFIQ